MHNLHFLTLPSALFLLSIIKLMNSFNSKLMDFPWKEATMNVVYSQLWSLYTHALCLLLWTEISSIKCSWSESKSHLPEWKLYYLLFHLYNLYLPQIAIVDGSASPFIASSDSGQNLKLGMSTWDISSLTAGYILRLNQ
jgi:hypothetical protein